MADAREYERQDDWRSRVPVTPRTDGDLVYAATARCPCGAGLAYAKGQRHWDCSDCLTGRAVPMGQPDSKRHTAMLSFNFYEIKEEGQPSANGETTRPAKSQIPDNPRFAV